MRGDNYSHINRINATNVISNPEHPLYEGNKERQDRWYAKNKAKIEADSLTDFNNRKQFTDEEIADAQKYGGCL